MEGDLRIKGQERRELRAERTDKKREKREM